MQCRSPSGIMKNSRRGIAKKRVPRSPLHYLDEYRGGRGAKGQGLGRGDIKKIVLIQGVAKYLTEFVEINISLMMVLISQGKN